MLFLQEQYVQQIIIVSVILI